MAQEKKVRGREEEMEGSRGFKKVATKEGGVGCTDKKQIKQE